MTARKALEQIETFAIFFRYEISDLFFLYPRFNDIVNSDCTSLMGQLYFYGPSVNLIEQVQ